ncbi:MAG: flagellin lysine-N-methylase [Lachnospiraceae bacterium]|nr:flagellin lysine-N-methylase [Lachnospiraceae bacterium]
MEHSNQTTVLKPLFYEKFQCIADRCTYSCCQDWNIEVDNETYQKYYANPMIDSELFYQKEGSTYIKHTEAGCCSFLREDGLCNLIIQHGDTILSNTCTLFPRTFTQRDDGIEFSLSNTCPAVLETLLTLPTPLSFVIEEDTLPETFHGHDSMEQIPYRDLIIDILQTKDTPFWKRRFVMEQFAGKVDMDKEHSDDYYNKYSNLSYLNALFQMLDAMPQPVSSKLQLSSSLFTYINGKADYYLGYKRYIQYLLPYVENPDWEHWTSLWSQFTSILASYDEFFENFCVNSMFRNGAVNLGEHSLYNKCMALILETAMIRFTLFLQWMNKDYHLSNVELIEISCYYARIMEHNSKNVYQFIKELNEAEFLSEADLFLLLR